MKVIVAVPRRELYERGMLVMTDQRFLNLRVTHPYDLTRCLHCQVTGNPNPRTPWRSSAWCRKCRERLRRR